MDKNGRMTHIERWTTRPPMYWMADDVKEVMGDDSLSDRECEIILDQALRRPNVFRLICENIKVEHRAFFSEEE